MNSKGELRREVNINQSEVLFTSELANVSIFFAIKDKKLYSDVFWCGSL